MSPRSPAQNHSLSEAASTLVSRIPQLFQRLRDLEAEEAKLDAQARQLMIQPSTAEDTPSMPVDCTPASKAQIPGTANGTPSPPPHIDPRNIETPVKNFLLMESLALAMSIKSRRRGRIFFGGDSTELGVRK